MYGIVVTEGKKYYIRDRIGTWVLWYAWVVI